MWHDRLLRLDRSELPVWVEKPALLPRRLVPRNLKPSRERRGRTPGISARRPYRARRTEPWLSVDAAHAEVFAFEEFLDAVSTFAAPMPLSLRAPRGAISVETAFIMLTMPYSGLWHTESGNSP
jgi:hypothetical protein